MGFIDYCNRGRVGREAACCGNLFSRLRQARCRRCLPAADEPCYDTTLRCRPSRIPHDFREDILLSIPLVYWFGFAALVTIVLVLDLGFFHRRSREGGT